MPAGALIVHRNHTISVASKGAAKAAILDYDPFGHAVLLNLIRGLLLGK